MAEPITKAIKGVADSALAGVTKNVSETIASGQSEDALVQLNYPGVMPPHQMIIKFYEYEYSAAATGKAKYGPKCSIAMPLPQNLMESSRLNVAGSQLGILGSLTSDILGGAVGGEAGANIKADLATADKTKLGEFFSEAFAGGIAAGADATVFITKALAGKISPQIGQAISASAGSALNNQTTLIFDGVDLKIQNFEWLFSPKNAEDQKRLDDIIRTINYFIHPDYKSPLKGLDSKTLSRTISRGLLTYPALMQIKLVGVSGGMNYVFRTNKFLMANQFNVDYTAGGTGVVLNKGGNAAVIRCSMNTTESEIRTRADYREGLPGNLGTDEATKDPSTDPGSDSQSVSEIKNSIQNDPNGDQQPDPVEENGAQDTGATTGEGDVNDRAVAYKVASGSNARGRTTYTFYNAAGKPLSSNNQDLQKQYPTKSQFLANPPVDR